MLLMSLKSKRINLDKLLRRLKLSRKPPEPIATMHSPLLLRLLKESTPLRPKKFPKKTKPKSRDFTEKSLMRKISETLRLSHS
jgi:hypothetical protein